MSFTHAYSLFELIIVISIISILCMNQFPSFGKLLAKAHLVSLMITADSYKPEIVELRKSTARKIETPEAFRVVLSISNEAPLAYVIELQARMKTKDELGIGIRSLTKDDKPMVLQMQATEISGNLTWTCHVPKEYNDYAPKNCDNNHIVTLNIDDED